MLRDLLDRKGYAYLMLRDLLDRIGVLFSCFSLSLISTYGLFDVRRFEKDPLEELKEEGKLEESEKETDLDLQSDARRRPGPTESNPSEAQHKFISYFTST
nr:hypothetical protein [Tanacetum cinerariifolium]